MAHYFYSFRRCPYAMRARLAIAYSGQSVQLREIILKEKYYLLKEKLYCLLIIIYHIYDIKRKII